MIGSTRQVAVWAYGAAADLRKGFDWTCPGLVECQSGSEIFPLERNAELVAFLREGIARGRIHVTLHGYHQRDEPAGYEFVAGGDLARKALDGKHYLEDLLGQAIEVFVPPHNSLGAEGYKAVIKAGLRMSGIPSFKPALRGWDPRVALIGLRERWYVRRRGHRRPWPVQFPDGHREIPYHSLTPGVSAARPIDEFEHVRRIGGVFCLATHYWEFDTSRGSGQRAIRSCLDEFWRHVTRFVDQVRYVNLSQLVRLTGE